MLAFPGAFLHSVSRMSIPNTKLDHILPTLNLQQYLVALLIESRVVIMAQKAHTISIPHSSPTSSTSPAHCFLGPTLAILSSLVLCMAGPLSFRILLKFHLFQVVFLELPVYNSLCRSLFRVTLRISFLSLSTTGIILFVCMSIVCLPSTKCNPIGTGTLSVLSLLYSSI